LGFEAFYKAEGLTDDCEAELDGFSAHRHGLFVKTCLGVHSAGLEKELGEIAHLMQFVGKLTFLGQGFVCFGGFRERNLEGTIRICLDLLDF